MTIFGTRVDAWRRTSSASSLVSGEGRQAERAAAVREYADRHRSSNSQNYVDYYMTVLGTREETDAHSSAFLPDTVGEGRQAEQATAGFQYAGTREVS
jgi:hypothetical protein